VALKAERTPLFIQCKNNKTGVKAMSQPDLLKLKEHSEQYGAVGIYVYTDSGKKYLYDTSTKQTIQLIPIPGKIMKEWVSNQKKHKKLKNILSCNCFIDDTVKHIYL
jgi:hypothetical protein